MASKGFVADTVIQENIDKIARLFPEVIIERGDDSRTIDFDLLCSLLGDNAPESSEYQWLGKRVATSMARELSDKLLVPSPEESCDWEQTRNLYIEGDNLDALKLLRERFENKVKLIYIDPPYNTGSASLIYADDFRIRFRSRVRCKNTISIDKEEAVKKETINCDWRSAIYPRLLLSKPLLRDDGAIMISIDDREAKNLRFLCDEVFGKENFICAFNWTTKKAAQGMTTTNMVVENHEYVFTYAKDAKKFKFYGLERNEKEGGFSNPDNDPRGVWKRQYLQRLGMGLPVRTLIDPNSGNVFQFETPYAQEKIDRWIEEDRILFPPTTDRYPVRKEFLSEYANRRQLVTSLGLYPTKATTEELYSLFGGVKIFTNPKPESLLRFLIEQGTGGKGGIVLDFYSGSATTADAVMRLNLQRSLKGESGTTLQYILVQNAEECNPKSCACKAGYRTIAEIGKERIRRVINKIRKEEPTVSEKLDLGFAVFKVLPS